MCSRYLIENNLLILALNTIYSLTQKINKPNNLKDFGNKYMAKIPINCSYCLGERYNPLPQSPNIKVLVIISICFKAVSITKYYFIHCHVIGIVDFVYFRERPWGM